MIRQRTPQELVEAALEANLMKQPAFAGTSLVRKVDEEGGDAPLQTHRIYRTVEGVYFLFICTAGQPGYLSVLSRKRAENALRSSPEIFRKEFGREPKEPAMALSGVSAHRSVLLGLLIAPLAPAAIALLGAVVALPFETRTFALASVLGYPVALLVGAPLYFLFRRRGWLKAWLVIFAGGAVGMLIPTAIALLALAAVAFLGAGFTWPAVAEVTYKYYGLILVGALSGIACASVFWLIAIAGATVKQPAPTNAN